MKKSPATLAAIALTAMAITLTGCASNTAQNSAVTGSKRLTDAPEIELENKLSSKQRESIPWGIGTGVSTDRQMARTESIAQAQAATARSAKLLVSGLLDGYAENVNGEARRITQDKINNYVDTQIEGSYVFETIMEFNEQEKKYSVYTLVLLDPNRIAEALKAAMEAQETAELKAASEKMQDRLEKMKAEYNALKK